MKTKKSLKPVEDLAAKSISSLSPYDWEVITQHLFDEQEYWEQEDEDREYRETE